MCEEIRKILPNFQFKGSFFSAKELKTGHINTTYHVICKEGEEAHEYILQKINQHVFQDPESVMNNILLVTEHLKNSCLKNGLDPNRRVLQLVLTTDGKAYLNSEDGSFWRAYDYITNAHSFDRPQNENQYFEIGRIFGDFQAKLIDFPIEQLADTIPNFHNTASRLDTFFAAIKADKAGRKAQAEPEIRFLLQHQDIMRSIVRRISRNEIPLRVTHNDTKMNNVLFDDESDKAICIVDLDTVMPGSVLYDFGDGARDLCNTASEDEKDLTKIHFDLDRFRLFLEGFLGSTEKFLIREEILLLPLGVRVITAGLAMRFLTDYLDGDQYFRIHYPEHNLDRARAQIALLKDLDAKKGKMDMMLLNILASSK